MNETLKAILLKAFANGDCTKEECEEGLKKLGYNIQNSTVGVAGDDANIGTLHIGDTYESPKETDWEHFYLNRLMEKCDALDLAAIDESCFQDHKTVRVPDVFTTLFLKNVERFPDQSVRDAVMNRGASKIKKMDMGGVKNKERQPVQAMDAVSECDRLVILGRPGGGKSTLINHMAGQLCRLRKGDAVSKEALPEVLHQKKPLPVRIVLRRFADAIPKESKAGNQGMVLAYLEKLLEEWGCREFHPALRRVLDKEGGLVFFDGLDEVRETDAARNRSIILESVRDFASSFKKCRVIVTCREYAYRGRGVWRLPEDEFPAVELDLFREEQIDQFTRTWYTVTGCNQGWSEQECRGIADALIAAVKTLDHLKELAPYPLLLTLMAMVHGSGGLPDNRADLYERSVNLLLSRWENRLVRGEDGTCSTEPSIIRRLNLKTEILRKVLEEIALKAHERQENDGENPGGCADIPREDIREKLAEVFEKGLDHAEKVLEYIQNRAGLLQADSDKIFSFPHRTFQEYLAATGLMRSKSEPAIELRNRVYRNPQRWTEVFLLAAGSARNIPSIIYQLLDVLLPDAPGETDLTPEITVYAGLAARTMWETKFIDRVASENQYAKIHKRVQDWLLFAMTADEVLAPKERVEAGNALNWVDDPRFDPDNYYLPVGDDMGFVLIEAGEFLMGSSEDEVAELVKQNVNKKDIYECEFPQHPVILDKYWISRYPVTVAQYRLFAEVTGRKLDNIWFKYNMFDNHPVVEVDWDDAKAYCEWLTLQLKKQNINLSLPTEAQWEKAARGRNCKQYPWGNKPISDEKANYSKYIRDTSPVGCFPGGISENSLLDMIGNVREWCKDYYSEGYYKKSPLKNPRGPTYGYQRVMRGGSCFLSANDCRSASRFFFAPDYRHFFAGFRLTANFNAQ